VGLDLHPLARVRGAVGQVRALRRRAGARRKERDDEADEGDDGSREPHDGASLTALRTLVSVGNVDWECLRSWTSSSRCCCWSSPPPSTSGRSSSPAGAWPSNGTPTSRRPGA